MAVQRPRHMAKTLTQLRCQRYSLQEAQRAMTHRVAINRVDTRVKPLQEAALLPGLAPLRPLQAPCSPARHATQWQCGQLFRCFATAGMKRSRSRKPKEEILEEEEEVDDDAPSRPAADSLEYYAFLGVAKTATPEEIRKAYQKMATKVHPDKNPNNKEEATKEFQKLAHIYSILSNETKRKFYDQFGDSGSAVEGLEDAVSIYDAVMEYVNSIRRVQKTDLDDFFGQIKQLRQSESVSPEEEKELRKFAAELKGDEKKILRKCHNYLPGFEKADEARVKKFLRSIATPPAAAGK